MKRHNLLALAAALFAALAGPVAAGQSSEPKVKGLATPVDASSAEHGVLVGRASAGDMLIQLDWDLSTLPYGQKLVSTFPEAPSSATIGPSLTSHLGNVG